MTSLLMKTGSCHGLSKEVNLAMQRLLVKDHSSFKKATKCLGFLVDQRILEKPVLELVEARLEKYLRKFLKWKTNILSLELLSSEQVKNSIKVEISDCVHLLWGFRNTGFFSEGFRDYLMFVIQENLSLLNNERYFSEIFNRKFPKNPRELFQRKPGLQLLQRLLREMSK